MRWRFLGEAYRGSGIWINDRGRRRLRDFQVRSVSFGTRSNRHSMRVRRARVAWASAKAFAIPELSSTPYWSVRCFANRRLHRALDRFPDSFQPLDRVGDPAPQLLRSLIQVEGPPAGRSPRGSLGISGHFRLQGAIPVHDAGRQPVASASASRRLCGHRLGRPPPARRDVGDLPADESRARAARSTASCGSARRQSQRSAAIAPRHRRLEAGGLRCRRIEPGKLPGLADHLRAATRQLSQCIERFLAVGLAAVQRQTLSDTAQSMPV
jgi:hypothetical protein